MTVNEALQMSFQKLKKRSPSPHLDGQVILADVLKKNREFILSYPEKKLSELQKLEFEKNLKRREKGEPVAYILKQKEFYGFNFKLSKNTLVPRPETELLLEKFLSDLPSFKKEKIIILDIGTGSGNIIISTANKILNSSLNFSNFSFYATDISKKALAVAKSNAKKFKLHKKITFLNGNLLAPVKKKLSAFFLSKEKKETAIVILANLPYLSEKIYQKTPPDVKNFEPKSALFSKKAGLYHYEKLFFQTDGVSEKYSFLNFIFYIEFSPEQKNSLQKLILKYFPESKVELSKDLSGKWRIAKIALK